MVNQVPPAAPGLPLERWLRAGAPAKLRLMHDKSVLEYWIVEALRKRGGAADLLEVCKTVWADHEHDLRSSGDLFYTWQYDIRWAGLKLRKRGVLAPASREKAREPWRLL